MKKTSRTKRSTSAESIARLAEKGQNISSYFTSRGKMMPALETENIDLDAETSQELNRVARKLNVTRQGLIKQFIKHGLDQNRNSQRTRKAG